MLPMVGKVSPFSATSSSCRQQVVEAWCCGFEFKIIPLLTLTVEGCVKVSADVGDF